MVPKKMSRCVKLEETVASSSSIAILGTMSDAGKTTLGKDKYTEMRI